VKATSERNYDCDSLNEQEAEELMKKKMTNMTVNRNKP
jgi:hypothetical protein